MPGCCPGDTFGAGTAVFPGVNRLPPVGLMTFSVGDGEVELDGDVVVAVVVDVDGDGWPLLLQAVARPAIAISAAPQARVALNRLSLTVFTMLRPIRQVSIVPVHAGRFGWRGRRLDAGCEQVAAGRADDLLRRRRRRSTRWWRHGRCRRRGRCRRLLAVVATSGGECAQRNERPAAGYGDHAARQQFRAHDHHNCQTTDGAQAEADVSNSTGSRHTAH
jgi:hypothetical protein